MSLTPQVESLRKLLTPKLTKYIPVNPFPKQVAFLLLDDVLEAFYGGAGFGGKSWCLLMGALQYVDVPGYNALLLRRSFRDLDQPGALMNLAHEWLGGTDAHWNGLSKSYAFPSGAKMVFGYMENEKDKFNYQGPNWHYVGFDEVTQMSENQYQFLFGWLRRSGGMSVPLRMRAASNPVGPGKQWVKRHFVDRETRGDRIFIPAKIDDNPFADKKAYLKSLAHLDPITRVQILNGDWEAQAGGKFRRHWFGRIVDAVPAGARYVRYWDLAATEPAPGKDPSYTVGALVAEDAGWYYVCDVKRERLTPRGVEQLVLQTAEIDGTDVAIGMEQEPGSSGVAVVGHFTRILARYEFKPDKVSGPKEIRANAFASQAEAGNVMLLRGPWVSDFLDEVVVFPGGGHDDQVVAAVGAFNQLAAEPRLDPSGLWSGGQRPTPDWD